MAASKDWILHKVDVKTTFLPASLEGELYFCLPSEILGSGGIFRLFKAFYDLKQASRAW
jgi:hypothetical protein